MKVLKIRGSTGDSTILIRSGLRDLQSRIPSGKGIIITDTNVNALYSKAFPPLEVIEIGTGEEIKTLDTVRDLYLRLVALEADRSSFIVGIGGGVVCDIAGFVASTYMRGVRFGFVSTTLLSQVDASVGGKNAVNLGGYKNIVGTFNQPEFVICDLDFLETLPEREIKCGLAEVVKHGVIADADLFSYLEENAEDALGMDREVMERLVYDSIVIKSAIVNRDEREKGERRKLNFGHTFGHAIEKSTGIPHGEAVSAGMVVASRISKARGLLSSAEVARIEGLLKKLGLPTEFPVDRERVMDALRKDKKREGAGIGFVLLRGIGNAAVEEISMGQLEAALDDLPFHGPVCQ